MAENVHEVVEQHHAFYEVQPYYTLVEEDTQGPPATTRRVQAGFDFDVFGIKTSAEQKPGQDYLLAYAALRKMVETILPHADKNCTVEVIPFGSTVVIDTKKQFQPEGMLRVRIAHKGVGQAGESEERLLKEIKERLGELGLKHR